MNVCIADNVPVVMLVRALANEGFELAATPSGMVLRLSTDYLERGQCCGRYVPEFLRYAPLDAAFSSNTGAHDERSV